MILDEIIANKRVKVASLKEHFNVKALRSMAESLPQPRDFLKALRTRDFALIAEIKKASPSAGVICQELDPASLAKSYQAYGASAVSVLTDTKYFQGKLEYLSAAKDATTIPVMCKDFIIDELQIYEARIAGADALLLIVRVLSDDNLAQLLKITEELGMQALVETHNAEEVDRALKAGAKVIGINNRDLDTLKIDLQTTVDLMKKFPALKNKIVIAESGVNTHKDVELLKGSGVNGVLIGEALMRSQSVAAKIKELLG